jgi:vacuolar-type H+-ATPase subunit E/Vma4
MGGNKQYSKEELEDKTTIQLMKRDIEEIKNKLERLPKEIIDRFLLEAEIIKQRTLEEARAEDDKRYAIKKTEELLNDKVFQAKVCNVREVKTGKWFWKNVLTQIFTSLMVAGITTFLVLKNILK